MDKDLRTHFGKYGKVLAADIPLDFKTGFNKKIAFVHMKEEEGLIEKVLDDYHIIDDQEVTVKLKENAKPGGQQKNVIDLDQVLE